MIAPDRDPAPNATAPVQGAPSLQSISVLGQKTDIRLSTERLDQDWDDFLQTTDRGQFQQSSLWAQAKQFEGWQCLRLVLEQQRRIRGGFQMLWRATRFGQIGYIIKGPVILPESPEMIVPMLNLLGELVRARHLLALIVQPPDFCRLLSEPLLRRGFLPDRLMNVISATCVVSLAGTPGAWEKNLGRSKRVEARRALRRGAKIRVGDLADVPQFFQLMSATCVRQQTRPNPPSTDALRRLVSVFRAAGAARLAFAEVEGQAVACMLHLKFGTRVTAWKQGWNGTHPDKHPNTLLGYEALQWAEQCGCKYLDFAGMDRALAEQLLAQQPLTEQQSHERDIFKLEFGAQPQLLPPALICWHFPPWRFFYRQAINWPWLASRLGRLARSGWDHPDFVENAQISTK